MNIKQIKKMQEKIEELERKILELESRTHSYHPMLQMVGGQSFPISPMFFPTAGYGGHQQ